MGDKDERRSWAFNRGCDARLAGLPRIMNPYYPTTHSAWAWNRGWNDVNNHWGQEAKWPFQRLPRVKMLGEVVRDESTYREVA